MQGDAAFKGNSWLARKTRRVLQKCAAVFNTLEIKLRPTIRLDGDWIIEWSFVAGNLTDGPGTALDFGAGHAWMGSVAVNRGQSTAVDLRSLPRLYDEPSIRTWVGDISSVGLKNESFDVIINCSSMVHVGLSGRYGVTSDATDGNLDVM